jgi:hypothetical protein
MDWTDFDSADIPSFFSRLASLGADFRALNNTPPLSGITHRPQRPQQMGNARPGQADADRRYAALEKK